ncbi:hypothetical protein [Nonomuraea sp. SYSU D8015]|uniref:hypothetical protein n=1 Tax=Nonomuraea sp. SYSU D8015 TaxID=2593644 RepID=UPI001660EDCC|nr:hypothetical protein [Nonomuraea sp. SYSU D8015]
MFKAGEMNLVGFFPSGLICEDGARQFIIDTLVNTTGIPEFRQRGLIVADDYSENDQRDAYEEGQPRISGNRDHYFRVKRREVESLDFSRIEQFLGGLRVHPMENVRSVELSFDDYSIDSRGLYDIPEVRTYLRTFQKRFSWWLWYFKVGVDSRECAGFVLLFLAGLNDPRRITSEELVSWLCEVTGLPLMEEGERAGVDDAYLTAFTLDVGDALLGISNFILE